MLYINREQAITITYTQEIRLLFNSIDKKYPLHKFFMLIDQTHHLNLHP